MNQNKYFYIHIPKTAGTSLGKEGNAKNDCKLSIFIEMEMSFK